MSIPTARLYVAQHHDPGVADAAAIFGFWPVKPGDVGDADVLLLAPGLEVDAPRDTLVIGIYPTTAALAVERARISTDLPRLLRENGRRPFDHMP